MLAPRLKTSDYLGMLRELAPELACSSPGGSCMPLGSRTCSSSSDSAVSRQTACSTSGDLATLARPGHYARLGEIAQRLTPDDPINIQFTSGTTGAPKGATLTHRNILNNGFFVGEAIGLTDQDRLCIPVPLYHCFGMVIGNLACITHGATMVYPAEVFEPRAVLAAIAGRALHGSLRRADHVHSRARPSRLREVRPLESSHRDHGGCALVRSR